MDEENILFLIDNDIVVHNNNTDLLIIDYNIEKNKILFSDVHYNNYIVAQNVTIDNNDNVSWLNSQRVDDLLEGNRILNR